MRTVALSALFLLSAGALAARQKAQQIYTIPIAPKPDFSSLAWLVGDWTGQTSSKGAPGQVQLSVSLALQGRFLLFKGSTSFTSADAATNSQESWLGILCPRSSGAGFDFLVYSSTGFRTRYRAEVTGPEISFSPEGGENPPPGWLFRRAIERTDDNEITETVEAAPPGKPFFKYYTAKLIRSAPTKPGSQPAAPAAPKPKP